jgi:hypothetical protein
MLRDVADDGQQVIETRGELYVVAVGFGAVDPHVRQRSLEEDRVPLLDRSETGLAMAGNDASSHRA